ncbi:hypothetical protein OF83DRAFT_1284144 [Amylostereum chailletii]|nr:hypothetical protein OF83DRAFT_1284144 [Amylostereum chailletii]
MTTNVLAIAILADGSLSLANEWNRVLSEYITPVLTRLANELYNGYQVRLAIITYGTADTRPSPVLCTRFFVNPVAISKEMRETPFALGVGVASQGERGMAALEGYAATIEMFDTLKNDTDFRPLRPLSMNQEKETQKNYACHILHVATSKPDPTRHPVHNNSPALDDLTWDSLPAELKKRNINSSMFLLRSLPRFTEIYTSIYPNKSQAWFNVQPQHTVLLAGFPPRGKVPPKRPGENIDRSPSQSLKRQRVNPIGSPASPSKPGPHSSPAMLSASSHPLMSSPIPASKAPITSAPPSNRAPSSVAAVPTTPVLSSASASAVPVPPPPEPPVAPAPTASATATADVPMPDAPAPSAPHAPGDTTLPAFPTFLAPLAGHPRFAETLRAPSIVPLVERMRFMEGEFLTMKAELHQAQAQGRSDVVAEIQGRIKTKGEILVKTRNIFVSILKTGKLPTGAPAGSTPQTTGNAKPLSGTKPPSAGALERAPSAATTVPSMSNANSAMAGSGSQLHGPVPAAIATQMQKLVERNGRPNPQSAPEQPQMQWIGMLAWSGTDSTTQDRKEVRAQVVAAHTYGDGRMSTWPQVLALRPAPQHAVGYGDLMEWIKKTNPAVCKVGPAPQPVPANNKTNQNHFHQLLNLLRQRNSYAFASWEVPGKGVCPTMLLMPLPIGGDTDMLAAVFPTTGIPEFPTPSQPTFNIEANSQNPMPIPNQAQLNQLIAQIPEQYRRTLTVERRNALLMQMWHRRLQQSQAPPGLPLSTQAIQQFQQQQQQQQHGMSPVGGGPGMGGMGNGFPNVPGVQSQLLQAQQFQQRQQQLQQQQQQQQQQQNMLNMSMHGMGNAMGTSFGGTGGGFPAMGGLNGGGSAGGGGGMAGGGGGMAGMMGQAGLNMSGIAGHAGGMASGMNVGQAGGGMHEMSMDQIQSWMQRNATADGGGQGGQGPG